MAKGSILMLLAILLTACREELAPPEVELPLWQVKAGETWTYGVTASYPPGTRPRYLLGESLEETKRNVIVKYDLMWQCAESIRDHVVIHHLRGGNLEKEEHLRVSASSVALRAMRNVHPEKTVLKKLTDPVVLVREEMEAGDTWTYELGEGTFRRVRVSGIESVTTPVGTFSATKIMVDGRSGPLNAKETFWWDEQIGMVKIERLFLNDQSFVKREILELKSVKK